MMVTILDIVVKTLVLIGLGLCVAGAYWVYRGSKAEALAAKLHLEQLQGQQEEDET